MEFIKQEANFNQHKNILMNKCPKKFIKGKSIFMEIHLQIKKGYILLYILVLFSSGLFSQDLPCATEISREYAEKMKKSIPEFEDYKISFQRNMSPIGRVAAGLKKNSIPVKIYIVRDNAGVTTLDTTLLRKGLTYMNKLFEGAGLEFYVCGSYNYINNTTYYNIDNTEYELLNNTYGTANVINMYMVNSITHAGSSAQGVAPTPGGSLWVMMRNNADTTVYPHEMGHFFGLLHTHGYSNTVRTEEFVDGSNCRETGDYICDTPADPRLSPAIVNGANVNSQCQYFGNQKDDHNQVYVPDAKNIMSYAPLRCVDHFSAEQLAFMNWVYVTERSNLTCSSINVNFNVSNSIKCDSPYVFQFQKQTTGISNFQWDMNDDGITDYTSNSPSHAFGSPGIKWVSLSGTAGGITYMRYKPVEISVSNKLPKLNDFNNSMALPNGWKLFNPDNGRSWGFANIVGADGQLSNVLRFKNYFYQGYEQIDAVITNAYDLRTYKNARLSFDIAYAPHNATDTFMVFVSTDCGNTYPTQILKLYGTSLQTHSKQFNEFIPTENDWKNIMIPLNSYIGNYVSFKIVNWNMSGNNLYIDNVLVEGGDSTLNEIGFGKTQINTIESSKDGQVGCRGYRIISVPVFISSVPTSAITINVAASGSASNTYDFELLNNQVIFPAGQTINQFVNVKIMDDAAAEVVESVILSLTIQGVNVYRTTSKNRSATITIKDNDPINPAQKIYSKVLLNENFNSMTTLYPPGWDTYLDGVPDSFATSWISTSFIGAWIYNTILYDHNTSLDSTHHMVFAPFSINSSTGQFEQLATPAIDVSTYDSITVELDHHFQIYQPPKNNATIEYDAWNGTTWVNIFTYNGQQGNIGNLYNPTHPVFSLTGYTNIDFKIRFGLKSNLYARWYMMDNLKITGFKTKARVASNLNSSTTAYLGPNELVHFYDNITGDIIASVQNQSSWNYGCTTVSIDRSGNGVMPYMDASPVYHATQKTLLITPEYNNPNGNYDISLYFKNAEINGWVGATTNSLINLGIVKSGGAIANITPSNPNANGTTNYTATNVTNQPYLINDYKITGRFTKGFSGFAGANTSSNNTLPIELLGPLQAVYVKDIGNEISWTTAQEYNCNYFEVQHSLDASSFKTIATIKGQGNSNIQHNYIYTDKNFVSAKNYYRFKQVDYNGKFTYSNMAMVNNEEHITNSFELFPNPVKDILVISSNDKNKQKEIRIVNAFGQEMKTIIIESNMQNKIDVSALSNGAYFVIITTNDMVETKAFVKE